jgi:hypothetical protein
MPPSPSSFKAPLALAFKSGRLAFELLVMAAIAAALWLSGSAAYENVHFVHTTGTILNLVSIAREDAEKDPSFGLVVGSDLIGELQSRGQLPGQQGGTAQPAAMPYNAWNGPIRASFTSNTVMRFETDLPTHDCRRLALFFGKDAADLSLLSMEARELNGPWRKFYDQATSVQAPNFSSADAACGFGEKATLALNLRLR